jgi:hypothetical protein
LAASSGDATFERLLELAEKRLYLLGGQFAHFDLRAPDGPWEKGIEVAKGSKEFYEVAIVDEKDKVEMYDRFLCSVDEASARRLFDHLRWDCHDSSRPAIRARAAAA